MGLKADFTMPRNHVLKNRVPKDLDGAYRVNGRLDKLTPADLIKAAKGEGKA
jgi:hypothetical protein